MKVRDLKKGQLIKPKESFKFFESYYGDWLNVSKPSRKNLRGSVENDQIVVYVGQKHDVGENTRKEWSDRYVLFKGKILPVDPHAWRKLEIAYENE